MRVPSVALKISAALWVVWGLVHMLAGGMTMTVEPGVALSNIADATDPALYALAYPDGAVAVLRQHGWNLAWVGLTTLVCAPYIWRGAPWAIALAALNGGLTDLGYFIFLDLGGHVHFMPGGFMTVVSGAAVVLSLWAHWRGEPEVESV